MNVMDELAKANPIRRTPAARDDPALAAITDPAPDTAVPAGSVPPTVLLTRDLSPTHPRWFGWVVGLVVLALIGGGLAAVSAWRSHHAPPLVAMGPPSGQKADAVLSFVGYEVVDASGDVRDSAKPATSLTVWLAHGVMGIESSACDVPGTGTYTPADAFPRDTVADLAFDLGTLPRGTCSSAEATKDFTTLLAVLAGTTEIKAGGAGDVWTYYFIGAQMSGILEGPQRPIPMLTSTNPPATTSPPKVLVGTFDAYTVHGEYWTTMSGITIWTDGNTMGFDTPSCLITGAGTFTTGGGGSTATPGSTAFSFDPGELANARCPGDLMKQDYAMLLAGLEQATQWERTVDNPNALGTYDRFSGPDMTILVQTVDYDGTQWGGALFIPNPPPTVPGMDRDPSVLIGDWRIDALVSPYSGEAVDTSRFAWPLTLTDTRVVLPKGCNTGTGDGYLATSDGRWIFSQRGGARTAMACAPDDNPQNQSEMMYDALTGADTWTLAVSNAGATSADVRLVVTLRSLYPDAAVLTMSRPLAPGESLPAGLTPGSAAPSTPAGTSSAPLVGVFHAYDTTGQGYGSVPVGNVTVWFDGTNVGGETRGTIGFASTSCLIPGTGTYVMGGDNDPATEEANPFSFDPGALAQGQCPGDQAKDEYALLLADLSQATRWSGGLIDNPHAVGKYLTFTGPGGTVWLRMTDYDGVTLGASSIPPAPSAVPDMNQDPSVLVGDWRIDSLVSPHSFGTEVYDTSAFAWQIKITDSRVVLQPGGNTPGEDGYLAMPDGRWVFSQGGPRTLVGFSADDPRAQSETVYDALLNSDQWTLGRSVEVTPGATTSAGAGRLVVSFHSSVQKKTIMTISRPLAPGEAVPTGVCEVTVGGAMNPDSPVTVGTDGCTVWVPTPGGTATVTPGAADRSDEAASAAAESARAAAESAAKAAQARAAAEASAAAARSSAPSVQPTP